jgi:hypothetical protein
MGTSAASALGAVQTSGAVTVGKAARSDMLDIEANLTIEVDSVTIAAAALRATAHKFDATVVEDAVSEQPGNATAKLTLRVASQQGEALLEAVGALGIVRSRQVSARDIGKEYFDSELRLENLQATMRRYEEILRQAKNVDEIMRVEGELGRLRSEIEQTKGNLRWLADRAGRATVHVNLVIPRREVATPPAPERTPEAKIYPGLRLTQLTDFRGSRGNTSFLGGGLAARFSRHFSIQVDALRESGNGSLSNGLDVLLLSIGGEMYSEFLGAGKRAYLNPHLGWTLGYARFTGKDEALLGISVGLELWKTKTFLIDAQYRAFGMFLTSDGPHLGVQPVLNASVAF